jgi:hypothetical protein
MDLIPEQTFEIATILCLEEKRYCVPDDGAQVPGNVIWLKNVFIVQSHRTLSIYR